MIASFQTFKKQRDARAAQYANLIRDNIDVWYADLISYEDFRARAERYWREIEWRGGSFVEAVRELLRFPVHGWTFYCPCETIYYLPYNSTPYVSAQPSPTPYTPPKLETK